MTDDVTPQPQEISIINEWIGHLLEGEDEKGEVHICKTMEDGTLRGYTIQVGFNGSRETVVKLEDDGTQRMQLIGWDGSAQKRLLTLTAGELKVALVGHDEAGTPNVDVFRTDPNRNLWVRVYEAYLNIASADIAAAEGVVLSGSAVLSGSGSDLYLVEFEVVSIDSANAVVVSVGRDDAAGGSLAGAEYWMNSVTIPATGSSGWRGPYLMAGDDDVRAVAGAANDAVIHFRVRRVDQNA